MTNVQRPVFTPPAGPDWSLVIGHWSLGLPSRPFNGVIDEPMATTINKQRLLNLLFNTAAKREPRSDVGGPEARPVLQQFIYGLCRENATPEQAERAYRFLCERFFDWNEVRVSSTRELEEAFAGMSGAEMRAQRLVAFLQEVF